MARNGDPRRGDDTGTHIITKTRPKTKQPSLYKVLLLNDDYTPMEFVVLRAGAVLQQAARGGDPHHAACPPEGRRHLWGLHIRGGRD